MHLAYTIVNYFYLLFNLKIASTCFDKVENKRASFWLVVIIIFNALVYITPLGVYFVNIPVSVFYYIPLGYLNKGHIFQKIFIYVSFTFLTSFFYWFSSLLAEMIYGYGTSQYYIAYVIIAVLFYILVYVLVYKYGKQLTNKLFTNTPTLIWGFYILLPIITLIIIGYNYLNQGFVWYPKPLKYEPVYILLPFFMLSVFGLLFSSILNTHNLLSAIHDRDFAKNVIATGSEHYQKMNELHEEIRVLRHDYKYHLNVIGQLLATGNDKELNRYLDDVQNEFNKKEFPLFCTNPVLNALVASYAQQFEDLEIQFDCAISLTDQIAIDNYQLCIVIGKILQNALEATRVLKDNKRIELLINKTEANQLAITCENTYDVEIETRDEHIISKKENGGFGIRSIQAVIQRYSGELLTEWDDHVFCIYVLLTV